MAPWFLRLLKICFSFLLAFPIGWNREQEDRSAGIRTFPLVAMGSCALMLLITGLPGQDAGAGAIIRQQQNVYGIATAASIWNMCIVGSAVGVGLYDIAVIMTLIDFIILRFLFPLKKNIDR